MGPKNGLCSWSSQPCLMHCVSLWLHLGCVFLWFVLWSLCWLKFNLIHPHPEKERKEKKIEMWDWWLHLLFYNVFSCKTQWSFWVCGLILNKSIVFTFYHIFVYRHILLDYYASVFLIHLNWSKLAKIYRKFWVFSFNY